MSYTLICLILGIFYVDNASAGLRAVESLLSSKARSRVGSNFNERTIDTFEGNDGVYNGVDPLNTNSFFGKGITRTKPHSDYCLSAFLNRFKPALEGSPLSEKAPLKDSFDVELQTRGPIYNYEKSESDDMNVRENQVNFGLTNEQFENVVKEANEGKYKRNINSKEFKVSKLEKRQVVGQTQKFKRSVQENSIAEFPVPDSSTSASGKRQYMNTVCKNGPGKIVCKAGRYTFVLNNGEHVLEPKTVETIIGLIYKRVEEGDKCFEVSVEEQPATPCDHCSPRKAPSTEPTPLDDDLKPITVECTPVANDNLTVGNPYIKPTEVIYECRWKVLGLKKRSLLTTLIVDDNKRGIRNVNEVEKIQSDNSGLPAPFFNTTTKQWYTAVPKRKETGGTTSAHSLNAGALKEDKSSFSSDENMLVGKTPPPIKVRDFGDTCQGKGDNWCPSLATTTRRVKCGNYEEEPELPPCPCLSTVCTPQLPYVCCTTPGQKVTTTSTCPPTPCPDTPCPDYKTCVPHHKKVHQNSSTDVSNGHLVRKRNLSNYPNQFQMFPASLEAASSPTVQA